MSSNQKSLTIIGATGKLSVPLIERLLAKNVKIKAVVRNLDKAKALLPESVQLVVGNVEDVQSLKSALQGTKHLYIHLNTTSLDADLPFHPEREGVANIVEAAKHNGVKQLLQIGGIESLHPDFAVQGMQLKTSLIRDQGMAKVKSSGIPYTLLYCSFFLDSFPLYIQDRLFAIFGELKHPLYFVNTAILAQSIYRAIGNPHAFNRAFAVQGKEGLTFPEAAKRFLDNYDPEVVIENFPLETINHLGLPAEDAAFMAHMMRFVEQLKEEFVAQETWQILGEPDIDIESFAKKMASK